MIHMNVGNKKEYSIIVNADGRVSFVQIDDFEAINTLRHQFDNKDLYTYACIFDSPDSLAQRTYHMYFVFRSDTPEKIRENALQAFYYISEYFNIPEDCIQVLYNGGVAINKASDDSNKNNEYGSCTAEIIILIPHIVFSSRPTLLMPAINYYLARQVAADDIQNIDIDVYQRNQLIPLPNSINTATGRYIIPLTMKEMLYLDGNGINELSKHPKPEDSLILHQKIPEAVEWFVEIHDEFEKKKQKQQQLQKIILEQGWEIPPCIRQLQNLCLYDSIRLETYRILSQFYSWIKASHDQIRHLVYSVDRRNPLRDYHRMNAIITFAMENSWFVGCEHPLLEKFCPAGKCFIAELIEDYENPLLFEKKEAEK